MLFKFYLYGLPSVWDLSLLEIVNVVSSWIEKLYPLINGFMDRVNR